MVGFTFVFLAYFTNAFSKPLVGTKYVEFMGTKVGTVGTLSPTFF
jgi:hypothetical protein